MYPALTCTPCSCWFPKPVYSLPLPTTLTPKLTVALYRSDEQVQFYVPWPLRPYGIPAPSEAQTYIFGGTSYTMSVCQCQWFDPCIGTFRLYETKEAS